MGWRDLEALNDRMIFTAYQEAVRLSFFKSGVVDPSRPLIDIQAILHHPGLDGAFTLGSGMLSAIAASTHFLVIERSRYPTLFVPNTTTETTKVRANARPGAPWYVVSKVNDRHSGILILELKEA